MEVSEILARPGVIAAMGELVAQAMEVDDELDDDPALLEEDADD